MANIRIVRHRYIYFLDKPWMSTEKVAGGCVSAVEAKYFTLRTQSWTLCSMCDVMYSCDPMAVPRYGLPLVLTLTPVSAKMVVASSKWTSLVISQVFRALP